MSTDTTLRQAKRAAFIQIADRLSGVMAAGRALKPRRNADMLRFEVDLPSGASGLIALATIKDGLPQGQFAFAPSVLVYGGPTPDGSPTGQRMFGPSGRSPHVSRRPGVALAS